MTWNRIAAGYNALIVGLAGAGALMIAGMFLLIIADVMIRTLGIPPPPFTIAVVEYGLLYYTMCWAPYLVRIKGHVFIEAFIAILPMSARRPLERVVYLVCVVSLLIFCAVSVQLLVEFLESGDMDIRGIDMPMWLLFVPMPVGFLLSAVEFARLLAGVDTMYNYDLGKVRENL